MKVRDIQRKAIKDTNFALNEIKAKEEDIQKAMEAVQSAEQGQKNVSERLGEKEAGILGDLEKIKKLAEANKLKASASLNRLNELAKEIKKIEEGIWHRWKCNYRRHPNGWNPQMLEKVWIKKRWLLRLRNRLRSSKRLRKSWRIA